MRSVKAGLAAVVAFSLTMISFYAIKQSHGRSVLRTTSDLTKVAVLDAIPISSSLTKAKQVFQSEGIKCLEKHNQIFIAISPPNDPKLNGSPADFLLCDSGERGFLVTKRWQVALYFANNQIFDVGVSTALTGM